MVNIINSLFENNIELIKANNFEEFSEKVLILYNSLNVYKNHDFFKKIKEKFMICIESLLNYLEEFSKDPIFGKPKISEKEFPILIRYLEYLNSAKQNYNLQYCISVYSKLLETQASKSSANIKNLNEIFNEFIEKISKYFDSIYNRIHNLFEKQGSAALTEVQTLITDMKTIRLIPEIECVTSVKYYQTIDKIRGYTQDLQNSVEKLLNDFDPDSKSTKWGLVIKTLINMQKNLVWINKVSPGVYETIMPKITEGLELHINNISQELSRNDINLKFPKRVITGHSILKKLDPLQDLEKIYPSLRILIREMNKRFYTKIQNCIDQFLIHFNLQNENIYKLIHQKYDLLNIKEDAEFEKKLLSTRFLLELNESFEYRKKKLEDEIIDYEESIQKIQTEINQLSQQNPKYDFSIKLDCQSATTALEFIENCENTSDHNLKILATGPLNLLTKYIREYGVNLDLEIHKNFSVVSQTDLQGDSLKFCCELDLKTSELLNFSEFSKIFEIIDGKNKVNNWHKIFINFYWDLEDKLQVAESMKNFEDSLKCVTICKALTCLDNFVKENGINFQKLYLTYKGSMLSGTRDSIRIILENISKLDFAQTNQLLTQMNERPINPSDLAQIKFDLKTVLNKLMRDIIFSIRELDDTIEQGCSTEKIRYINENILIIREAMTKIELNEYLDNKTKENLASFENQITEIYSEMVIKTLKSIENYIDSCCLSEVVSG